jgi:2-(3-amino-3-carboxypropyl)histidine synthase
MDYDMELSKAVKEIKKTKAKKVLIQLPEGLKPQALEIADKLEETGANIHIWSGTCFGGCDVPNVKGYDLLIQWGHSVFER